MEEISNDALFILLCATDDAVTLVAACSTVMLEVHVLLESAVGAFFTIAWVSNFGEFLSMLLLHRLLLTSAMELTPEFKIPLLLVVAPAGVTTDCFL